MPALTRREWLKAGLGSLGALALGSTALAAPAPRKPPNLLFVFPDQFRRAALADDPVDTPHLDRFAREGRVFTNAVSNCPVCSPYRAMMLTGRYPFATGVTKNAHRWINDYCALPPTETCISDVLAAAGYDCGYIGKWHLDAADLRAIPPGSCDPRRAIAARRQYLPRNRRHGFNYWHAYIAGNLHMTPQYWVCSGGIERYIEPPRWSAYVETDAAVSYLANDAAQRRADKPFALFVSLNPPHPPYEDIPADVGNRYAGIGLGQLLRRPNADLTTRNPALDRARAGAHEYFGAIHAIDQQFGRILQTLKTTGLERDTLVVFTSDHGDMLTSHGLTQKNYWYEESLNVPLIVRFPGRVTRGSDDLFVSVPDLMPTMLGLMGLSRLIPSRVQGRNLTPLIRGVPGTRPDSALYLSVPVNDWSARGFRNQQHTFAVEWTGQQRKVYLFDDRADRYQMRNLAPQRPGWLPHFERQLAAHLEATGDPWRDRFARK